jgi:hypothetical protein
LNSGVSRKVRQLGIDGADFDDVFELWLEPDWSDAAAHG